MICCVTGHRPKGFPFQRDSGEIAYTLYLYRLHIEIEKLIREGYRDFITGMAEGANIDLANAVLYLRDTELFITLEAALPYPRSPRKRPAITGDV